jgi:rhodanese-related sulfurtransferase
MEDITVKELKEKLDKEESFILIDVREPHEHQEFNVGGRLIPVGTLPTQLSQLEGHKDEEIVVYCRSGNRSGMAKQYMEQNGFNKVRNLLGGMLKWQEVYP